MAGAEIEIARSPDHLRCVKNILKPIVDAQLFDYILLDCPPSLGILMTNALVAADSVLIPMQCEYYALEGLSAMITRVIQGMKTGGANPSLEIEGILMTMFDNRTNLCEQVVQDVRKHYGMAVYKTLIPRSVRVSEAPSYRLPVVTCDPSSKGAEAYAEFGREFLLRASTWKVAKTKLA